MKISHALSYPIGAEFISAALNSVPQYDQLVLRFVGDPWNQTQRAAEVMLLRCLHSSRYGDRADQHCDEKGIPLFGEWQINIYAVPKEIRHRVREFLVSDGLLQTRSWLARFGTSSIEGEQAIEFFLDTRKDEVRCRITNQPRPGITRG